VRANAGRTDDDAAPLEVALGMARWRMLGDAEAGGLVEGLVEPPAEGAGWCAMGLREWYEAAVGDA
jgi:hypothetical protein